ncbi:MAG: hypothetical protein QOJ68_2772 [Blastococcus sp.]|nr:hypothetical protein [Blastococcus sp.]
MHVMLALPSSERGGCEEYAIRIGLHLRSRGHAVTVAVPQVAGTASIRSDCGAAGMQTTPWPADHGATCTRDVDEHVAEIASVLAALAPDRVVVVAPWPDTMSRPCLAPVPALAAAARTGIRTCAVFQLAHHPVALDGRTAEFGRRALRDQVWCAVSQQNRTALARTFHVDESSIRVVANGVEPYPLPASEARRAAQRRLRRRLRLADDTRILLSVGRLVRSKGHRVVVEALSMLPPTEEHHLLIAGVGDDEPALRMAIEEHGIRDGVSLLGHRGDVRELLLSADAFVFMSTAEGASFALLEAMEAACPVVVADAASNAELVRPETDGIVVPAGDATALVKALRRLARHDDASARLACSAATRVRRDYPASAMLDGVTAALRLPE